MTKKRILFLAIAFFFAVAASYELARITPSFAVDSAAPSAQVLAESSGTIPQQAVSATAEESLKQQIRFLDEQLKIIREYESKNY